MERLTNMLSLFHYLIHEPNNQWVEIHSPIPPSASMASSNHLHGQPCPWPVVYAALVHGAVPPPFFLPQM